MVFTIHGYDLLVAITALLGPEQPGLLLRPPDEQDSLGAASGLERRQVLMHHIVFALPPGEVNGRDVLTAREATDLRGEAVGDPGQRGGQATGRPICRCT